MMPKRQSRYWGYSKFCILAIMFLLWGGYAFAAEQSAQYKIFTLKHISAEQGKKYLAQLDIGTVSQIPGASVLLVTARGSELTKAMAILKLVDAEEEFAIRAISPVSEVENLPSNEQIAARVGGISIGTFFSPPENQAGARAIIDVHNDSVVAIAPVGLLEKIVSVIGQPEESKVKKSRPVGAVPAGPSESSATAFVPSAKAETWVRPYEPEPLPNGDEILNLNLPEKLDLVSLLGLVGEYLQLDYMYDPAQVKGEVTLKLQGKLRGAMRVKDLYPLLESVMKFRGFVMTRKVNLVTIVPVAQMLENDPTLTTDERKIEFGDVVITRAFQLKHIDTTSAINLLNSMKLGTTVSPIPDAGTLIVTEYAYRMARIEELLDMIDKPGTPKRFRFRQLIYTMAKTLAPKIKTLAEQLGTVSITVAAAQAPTPVPPGRPVPRPVTPPPAAAQTSVYLDADERTNRILMIGLEEQLNVVDGLIDALDTEQQDLRTMKIYKIEHVGADEVKKKLQELGIIGGTAETPSRITARAPEAAGQPPAPGAPRTAAVTTGTVTEALVEQPQVVVLEPTNSLLINATAEQHAQIAGIIKYVDSETEKGTIPYVIYPLENQKPEDMEEVLNKLIKETIKDKEGKIQQVVKKTEEEITIVPDKNTCSIIVYASKKNQEWIANLIKTLDKRRPQVLIDVTLVEITKSDSFDYDLNLIKSFPDLVHTSGLTGVLTRDAKGAATKTSSAIISDLSSSGRDRFIDLQSESGQSTGFYGDKHINALLTAMQTKDYGRVLAKPKILVNDNEKGTIKTTDTRYVTKKSSTPITNTTTGTPVQQTWDTAISYEPYDAGITLDITPHISEGKLLRLEVSLTRSDFDKSSVEDRPPGKTSSDINTIVTVPDGSTIILGGMLKLNQGKGGTKVPLLGDIPLVGGLFRSITTTDSQRKLYVFVKAEIIRPAETAVAGLPDLERISERNRMAFEKHEAEFQGYEDWPGIKPKPVEPFKILEAQ